jgi:hypothetical protein
VLLLVVNNAGEHDGTVADRGIQLRFFQDGLSGELVLDLILNFDICGFHRHRNAGVAGTRVSGAIGWSLLSWGAGARVSGGIA